EHSSPQTSLPDGRMAPENEPHDRSPTPTGGQWPRNRPPEQEIGLSLADVSGALRAGRPGASRGSSGHIDLRALRRTIVHRLTRHQVSSVAGAEERALPKTCATRMPMR